MAVSCKCTAQFRHSAEVLERPTKQAHLDVTSGSGRKYTRSSKSAFQQQKAEVEGANSHPCGLAVRRPNPGLVIAQFPVVKTHFGSLPQRELPPERNPSSLPQAPSGLSWAECTCAACHERRCSGSQQCHSRCRGTLEQPLLEREYHLKHKNIRQDLNL